MAADPSQIVAEVMASRPEGLASEALAFWEERAKEEGASGIAARVMAGLLEFSGQVQLERSAGELGARVGANDSALEIAKTTGKLTFDLAVAGLNLLWASGKLAGGVGKAVGAAPTVVRHYTDAQTAAKVMASGEIWASKVGNAGFNKVYLVAGEPGMSILRRFNLGKDAASTTKAIEIDLSLLPSDVAAGFVTSSASGPLSLERFVTHAGNFDFSDFRHAVRVLDTEALAVTIGELRQVGASFGAMGTGLIDVNRAGDGAAQAGR